MGNQQLHPPFGTTWQAFVLFFLVFSSSQLPIVHAQQPFLPAETARALSGSTHEGNALEKRQGCISNFFSCSGVGAAFSDVCCQFGYTCALDQSNQPACCPVNAVCTGTAPANFAAPSPTAPVSFVANPYFSFPYVATYFPDAEQCSSAVSQCSANYVACSNKLDGLGGQYGVTIVVPGGAGTTVAVNVGTTVGLESASRICSSLSSVACHGLETNMCSMTATTASGFYFGTGAPNRASSRRGLTGLLVAAGVVATVSALL